MITKFKSINNLAIFQNFDWDSNLRDSGNNVISFKDINIFYGRNYSGKTTLSRIVRALETGKISDKYENPEFEVCFAGESDATQSELNAHGKKIRVFNEDFVKENLRFIVNSNESITPFAILGGNATIEEEIVALKSELGVNEEGNESGFYLELKNAISTSETASKNHQTENNKLEQQLTDKATNRIYGIKYKSEKFGDQNYTKAKLESDAMVVMDASFTPLTDDEVAVNLKLLDERVNQDIQSIAKSSIDIKSINEKVEKLITKPISSSDKIEQLVKDSILNRWVKEGRQIHKGKFEKCSFCGSDISEARWKVLDSHFDEESEKLEKEIDLLIREIENSIIYIDSQIQIDKNLFYSKFHSNLDRLILLRNSIINSIKAEFIRAKNELQERKDDLLNPKIHNEIIDNSKRLEWCWKIFDSTRLSANSYSKSLGNEQARAKKSLRLREVSDFVNTVQYSQTLTKIKELKIISESTILKKREIGQKIKSHLALIRGKERLMNDEEKGALKVNEYLNNFFGHDFLTLQALEDIDQSDGKKIRFEIVRNGKKAHHLSEGECSLIAFCYFMAKLEDVDTKGSKPIIWIDDPISSLDSNHIFFVYSLLNSEIVSKRIFEQLFVSTHNLDFLKYLKRIKLEKNKYEFFIVARDGNHSYIRLMPSYLKDYTTEFNYLFEQIYKCANATDLTDENHHLFYNFGNNARKFLEALLFYKYPSRIDNQTTNANSKRLLMYFGDDHQAAVLTERVNNELSHLEEIFDRGMIPIEIPELKKVAQFILYKMEHKDREQYEALLESIGVEIAT